MLNFGGSFTLNFEHSFWQMFSHISGMNPHLVMIYNHIYVLLDSTLYSVEFKEGGKGRRMRSPVMN